MTFINPGFLLHTKTARRLYDDVRRAPADPRLPQPSSAEGHRRRTASFANLFEIWLEGDHYKWRAMRANGIDERYCTGDATLRQIPRVGRDGAEARCATRSTTGPIWSCRAISGSTICWTRPRARPIWDRANERLAVRRAHDARHPAAFGVRRSARPTIRPSRSTGTQRSATSALETGVYPTFRPDSALDVHLPDSSSIPGSTGSPPPPTPTSARFHGFPRRAARTPPGLPRRRRTPLRSRPALLLCGRLHRRGGRGGLRPGARRPGRTRRSSRAAFASCMMVFFAPPRRREGLDASSCIWARCAT